MEKYPVSETLLDYYLLNAPEPPQWIVNGVASSDVVDVIVDYKVEIALKMIKRRFQIIGEIKGDK